MNTLNKAKQLFVPLPNHAIKSLCLAAESLVKPMRLGAVRPVESFTPGSETDDVVKTTEELFALGPMVPRRDRKTSHRSRRQRNTQPQSNNGGWEMVKRTTNNTTRRWREELRESTGRLSYENLTPP